MIMEMKTKFYNADIKERYFATIQNETTREITEYAFKKASKTEKIFGKDIYEMNINELAEVMKGLSASTPSSAYNQTFKFQHYIDWATENGLRQTNINPLETVDKKEWVKPFVSEYKQSYFTREQILDMCNELINYPDKAILLALFEGISGEGYSELLNLRINDIKNLDGRYFAALKDKNDNQRTIEISEELAHYFDKANSATEYYNKNGLSDSVRSSRGTLVESSYIFKKSSRGKHKEKDEQLDLFFINRKFVMFKEIFGTKHLRPKEVINSGIMHMANEIFMRDGELGLDQLKEIADRFDTTYSKYNDEYFRNTHVIKERLDNDFFKETYNIKLK
nr:phage integrase family protein [Bacillus sp. FJAT-22090]